MDEFDNGYDNDDDDQIIPSTELINIVDVDGDENEDGIFSSTAHPFEDIWQPRKSCQEP